MNTNDEIQEYERFQFQPQDAASSTAPVRITSLKGRIGRLRMIAYPFTLSTLLSLPLITFIFVARPDFDSLVVGAVVVGLVCLGMTGIWTVRRVQDFNGPWWVSAIFILTLIFFSFANLLLWFIPGTKGENRYGPPPPANGAGIYVLAFLLPGVVFIGILAAVVIPAYQDYTVRVMIQEGVNVSSVHRTALELACREGKFREGLSSVELGLADPSNYSYNQVDSVAVIGVSEQVAEITVTYRAIGNAIKEGQTVIYVGTCRDSDIVWEVAGSIPTKFLPKM